MGNDLILRLVTMLVTMFLSLTVHEFAHAAAARYLGDDTAERMGRLTLNPLAHIDPIGTVAIPVILAITGSGLGFGWAKPVPFNPSRFRRDITMRTGTMIVAAAGPASNVLFATLMQAGLAAVYHLGIQLPAVLVVFMWQMLALNVVLALFNLIPVGPLDGRKVLSGLLPPDASINFERFNERYSIFLLGGVVIFGWSIIEIPVKLLINLLAAIFGMSSLFS